MGMTLQGGDASFQGRESGFHSSESGFRVGSQLRDSV